MKGVLMLAGAPFADLEPLLILPEHQVLLPGGRTASQSDIWVLARTRDALVSIAVEGTLNQLHSPLLPLGRGLHFAWVRGEEEYLSR